MCRLTLLLLMGIAIIACSRPEQRTSAAPNTPAVTPPASRPIQLEGATKDFRTFWDAFRNAVLHDDSARAADLTKFPLEVRGETDDEPPTHVGREQFDATLHKLLMQDSGARPEGETVGRFLAREDAVDSSSLEPDGNAARVGDFVFERGPKGWQLVRVYLRSEA
jgi:hypothetical protein